jgi:hypothetical protein
MNKLTILNYKALLRLLITYLKGACKLYERILVFNYRCNYFY